MSWIGPRSVDGGLDSIPLPISDGGLWLCGKRVVGPDPEAALVRADHADAIVSFNEEREIERDYPEYVEWLRREDGRRAHWFPIPDFHAPDLASARSIVDVLVARIRRNESLILHCAGGIGRAPTMGTCVLIALGMPTQDALSHIRRHRPMAGPEVGAQHDLVAEF